MIIFTKIFSYVFFLLYILIGYDDTIDAPTAGWGSSLLDIMEMDGLRFDSAADGLRNTYGFVESVCVHDGL